MCGALQEARPGQDKALIGGRELLHLLGAELSTHDLPDRQILPALTDQAIQLHGEIGAPNGSRAPVNERALVHHGQTCHQTTGRANHADI